MSSNSCEKGSLSVAEQSLEDLFADPDFPHLVDEYASVSLGVFDKPSPNYAHYRALDATGSLNVVTLRSDGRLVGFILLWVYNVPHHARPISKIESIYVLPAHRGGGGARLLLDTTHSIAERRGCQGVGLSIPITEGPQMARAMRLLGFTPTHQILFKPCTN